MFYILYQYSYYYYYYTLRTYGKTDAKNSLGGYLLRQQIVTLRG